MTHGGLTLEKWEIKMRSRENKETFALVMLKQLILGLKKIHNLGYSHGDLKPANICARQSSEG